MAAIYLIRHGQASFGSADYDQLSEKGREQSLMLGKYWRANHQPSKFYSGNLLRHCQTSKYFIDNFQVSGTPITIHSGFNEFDHVDILTNYNAQWQDFTKMSKEINHQPKANKVFQHEFAQALNLWLSGDKDHQYKESWPQFKDRCVRALQDVIKQALADERENQNEVNSSDQSKDILVFTSGGPISAIIQHVLQLSDEQALRINQQLRNTSVTKLLFSGKNISVDYFNNYSHLEQAGSEWITFR